MCFFMGAAIKTAVLNSELRTQCPCANQCPCPCPCIMICSLKFRKDVYLKDVSLDFVLLLFKLYPIQVVISIPLWIKPTMGLLLLFLLCSFRSFFSLCWRCLRNQPLFTVIDRQVYFGYPANYNTRGAFVMLFLICSDLLNCLRSLGTMVITTESALNSLKVIFTSQFPTKVTIFCCFDVYSVRSPQIF